MVSASAVKDLAIFLGAGGASLETYSVLADESQDADLGRGHLEVVCEL